MITTILADLDGTMVMLKELHRKAFQEAIFRVAGLSISDEWHDEHLCGLPTSAKLQKIGIANGQAIQVNNLKQELTLKALENLEPDEDLYSTLHELSIDYNLFCVSNSLRNTVELVLNKLGVIKLFNGYYGNDDVFCAKPSPEMYYKAMCQFGCPIHSALAVEDSPVGIETIKRAGVHGLTVKDKSEFTYQNIFARISGIESK